MFNAFHKSVYIPQDISPEAKSLIEKFKDKFTLWRKDLGRELIKYSERPDLILEVLRQLAFINHLYPFDTSWEFIESVTDTEIQKLTESKYGNLVLNRIFNILFYAQTKLPVSESNKITNLIMRVENIRVRISGNDKRPLIADMVEKSEGLQLLRYDRKIDDTWLLEQNAYRFGIGHDGEHILGDRNGSRVRIIPGLTGTILTWYQQSPDKNYAVYILLEDNANVLVLKDLVNLNLSVQKSVNSTKGANGVPKFIDKRGNPVKSVKIGTGEILGYTSKWDGENNQGAVGMHFTIVKYEFIQQFRDALGTGTNTPAKYPNWFTVPCGNSSPFRCK